MKRKRSGSEWDERSGGKEAWTGRKLKLSIYRTIDPH